MKNKLMKYINIAFLSLLAFASCSKEEPTEYVDEPALFFSYEVNQEGNSSGSKIERDSISFTFFNLPSSVGEAKVEVEVKTMGKLSDKDRHFMVKQINLEDENSARAGIDFIAFDSQRMQEEMVIPAGKNSVMLPIYFLRNSDLDLTTKTLIIVFSENENFKQGIVEKQKFRLTVTNQTSKPSNWDTFWAMYFGASWGTNKMRLIIDSTGYTEWDQNPLDIEYLSYMRSLAIEALLEYNRTHSEPLKEASGELVVIN